MVVLGLLLSGCPRQVPAPQVDPVDAGVLEAAPPPVEVPTGPGLLLAVEPPDAELVIDGTSYGPVAGLKTQAGLLSLKPGIYQVALKRPGYVSWRAEVTINEAPERLKVSLVRQ